MTFLWPFMLFSLVLVPVIILLYVQRQQKRRGLIASFARFSGDKLSQKQAPAFRRHLPPLLFLLGLVILMVALARPHAQVNLPRVEGTVILIFDVSGSMAANDVEPTRMEAAKVAAREFILSQPETVQIGIVSFSGSGFAVVRPTNDTQNLLAAITRLTPQTGTSLGQGILVALNTIALDAGLQAVTPTETQATPNPGRPQEGQPPENSLLSQLPEGPYPSALIVLLSDGENNQSIDPLEAAQAAADHAVRIDSLGFGTANGVVLEIDGFKVHTALDEEILQQVSQLSGGAYYNPQNEADPRAIYANLTPQFVIKAESVEITSLFAGASILILLIGAGFSLVWLNKIP